MRFRVPEIVLGALLTIAIFSAGMIFATPESSGPPHQIATESAWLTKDAAGFFTFVLVLVGCFQAGLFLWQLYLIRASLDDAKIAADAAADAARAATRQADVAEQSLAKLERPYIFIFNLSPLCIDRDGDADGDFAHLSVTFSVANYGKIPAIIESAAISLSVSADPLDPALIGSHHTLSASPIFTTGETRLAIEESYPWEGDIDRDEWSGEYPSLGDNSLFFWAVVCYRGPFTGGHKTSICLRYDSRTNRFVETLGTQENNYQT